MEIRDQYKPWLDTATEEETVYKRVVDRTEESIAYLPEADQLSAYLTFYRDQLFNIHVRSNPQLLKILKNSIGKNATLKKNPPAETGCGMSSSNKYSNTEVWQHTLEQTIPTLGFHEYFSQIFDLIQHYLTIEEPYSVASNDAEMEMQRMLFFCIDANTAAEYSTVLGFLRNDVVHSLREVIKERNRRKFGESYTRINSSLLDPYFSLDSNCTYLVHSLDSTKLLGLGNQKNNTDRQRYFVHRIASADLPIAEKLEILQLYAEALQLKNSNQRREHQVAALKEKCQLLLGDTKNSSAYTVLEIILAENFQTVTPFVVTSEVTAERPPEDRLTITQDDLASISSPLVIPPLVITGDDLVSIPSSNFPSLQMPIAVTQSDLPADAPRLVITPQHIAETELRAPHRLVVSRERNGLNGNSWFNERVPDAHSPHLTEERLAEQNEFADYLAWKFVRVNETTLKANIRDNWDQLILDNDPHKILRAAGLGFRKEIWLKVARSVEGMITRLAAQNKDEMHFLVERHPASPHEYCGVLYVPEHEDEAEQWRFGFPNSCMRVGVGLIENRGSHENLGRIISLPIMNENEVIHKYIVPFEVASARRNKTTEVTTQNSPYFIVAGLYGKYANDQSYPIHEWVQSHPHLRP